MLGGTIQGRYRVLEEVASSPRWIAYLARDLKNNRIVRITIYGPEVTGTPESLQLFHERVRLLSQIESAHTAAIVDTGTVDGRNYVVYEHVEGKTLRESIAGEERFSLEAALGVGSQLAQCLADIAVTGAVLGDLNPGKIAITGNGAVKVTSFHITLDSLLDDVSQEEDQSARHYLAPELLRGLPGGSQSDVYSVGVMLFEMLTGQVPHPDAGIPQLIRNHLDEDPPSASSLNAEVSPELEYVIRRCLETDPADRYLPPDLVGAIADLISEAAWAPAAEGVLVGQNLGRYQLIERVAQGGMSSVYKAYQTGLDRYVAVKVLPTYFPRDSLFTARFHREAKAIARLRHPNILQVYDVGQEGDLAYIVMQWIEGGTLKDRLGQPMPLDQVVEIISQIAAALDEAHSQGIVHRDVKPSNVLMAKPDWIVLSDFGLARMLRANVKITHSGATVGTPAYMSPEQGKGIPVESRTDVYSLGVIAFEMLTGSLPFEAETPMGVIVKHITAPMPRPTEFKPDIPKSVERVVLEALAKDPADRHASAGDFAASLARAVAESQDTVSSTSQDVAEPLTQEDPAPVVAAPEIQRVSDEPRKGSGVWRWVAAAVALILMATGATVFGLGRTDVGQVAPATPSPTAEALVARPEATSATALAADHAGLRPTETKLTTPTTTASGRAEMTASGAGAKGMATTSSVDARITLAANRSGTAAETRTPVRPAATNTYANTIPTVGIASTSVPSGPDQVATAAAESRKVAMAVAATLTSRPTPTATRTQTPTKAPTPLPPTSTATRKPASPTLTRTPSPTPPKPTKTSTPVPPTPTSTSTPMPPTPDLRATVTAESRKIAMAVAATLAARPTSTATETRRPTEVPTSVSSVATANLEPVQPTPTGTSTPIPPTADLRATMTAEAGKVAMAVAATLAARPTETHTPTATFTRVPPTTTSTSTGTPTPSATVTSTASPTPSATAMETATDAAPTYTPRAIDTPSSTPSTPAPQRETGVPTITPDGSGTLVLAALETVDSTSGVVTSPAPDTTAEPTLYSAPVLIDPGNGFTTGDGRVSLKWGWDQELGPDECFELVMSGSLDGPFWGAVSCMREKAVTFNVLEARHIQPGPVGQYYWTVRVNRESPPGVWDTVSSTPEPRELRLLSGGGQGGAGGSGGGKDPPPP